MLLHRKVLDTHGPLQLTSAKSSVCKHSVNAVTSCKIYAALISCCFLTSQCMLNYMHIWQWLQLLSGLRMFIFLLSSLCLEGCYENMSAQC